MPNIAPLILANTTLTVPIAILSETTLSFLGLGDPTRAVVGQDARGRLRRRGAEPARVVVLHPPGLGVMLVVLAFVLCGHALEEILDPRLREQRS